MFQYPYILKLDRNLFGHQKTSLNNHRSLSEQQSKDFTKWYLFLNGNNGESSISQGPELIQALDKIQIPTALGFITEEGAGITHQSSCRITRQTPLDRNGSIRRA